MFHVKPKTCIHARGAYALFELANTQRRSTQLCGMCASSQRPSDGCWTVPQPWDPRRVIAGTLILVRQDDRAARVAAARCRNQPEGGVVVASTIHQAVPALQADRQQKSVPG